MSWQQAYDIITLKYKLRFVVFPNMYSDLTTVSMELITSCDIDVWQQLSGVDTETNLEFLQAVD